MFCDASSYTQSIGFNPDRGQPMGIEAFEYLHKPLGDAARRIVIQKGAQIGATVMAILRTLWFLDQREANCMYLFPTHRSAARFSRGRFQVLLEQSSYYRELFRRVKNATHMRAGTANFYCHGSRSRPDLLSTPVQFLILDERDELFLGAATSRQPWSAVELARQRLAGQRNCWELNLSTPTIPGHGIAAEFAASDQHYYAIACPHCGDAFVPTWPDAIAWQGEDANSAAFRCQVCGRHWSDCDRLLAVRNGVWVARAPGRAVRGYHLSQLVSPKAQAPRLVRQWLDCEGSDHRRQVFFNSVLGLPYLAEGAILEERFVHQAIARGGDPMAKHSQGSVLGIDVGPTWLHVVCAEPSGDALRLIWAGKVREWRDIVEFIPRYHVRSYVVDAMPETHQVRDLLRQFPQGWMCYYRGPGSIPLLDANERILRVSRTDSLDAMYERWRLGKIAAPRDLPAEFSEQLRAPIRVLRQQSDAELRGIYVDSGGADHYAHAMNYCELALQVVAQPLRWNVMGRFA